MFALLGVLARATTATAADPTKEECIAESENAQDLRHAGRLREARVLGAVCIAATCPGPVREDCARVVDEVENAMPTVVFDVKDGAGNDVGGVRVTIDGQPLSQQLGGTPIELDPGEHRFFFEADGLPNGDRVLVLREGDKNRIAQIVLGAAPMIAASYQEVLPARVESAGGGQRAVGLWLGGAGIAGLAIGSVFGLFASSAWSSSKGECATATNCSDHNQAVSDHDTAVGAGTVSTIGFLAGGALLATGAVIFFTAPSKHDRSSGSHLEVTPRVGRDSGGLILGGRF
jgi:hypothetical protein